MQKCFLNRRFYVAIKKNMIHSDPIGAGNILILNYLKKIDQQKTQTFVNISENSKSRPRQVKRKCFNRTI
jgi:hypothetical protein